MTVTSSRLTAIILLVLALAITGCGGGNATDSGRPVTPATLVLDFNPNAVHAGTYLAVARGLDRREGVRMRVRSPSAGADSIKLLRSGRADLAYLDIHDLAIADEKSPGELVAVMALVQRPLAALLAAPSVERPRDLEGQRVGVSGLPSDVAVLRSIVSGDGGDPDRVRTVTIGFQAVPALVAGRISAATAFWNVEGLALKERRPATREFRVEDFGAPPYPELVLVVRRETLRERAPLVKSVIAALRAAYTEAIKEPDAAIDALVAGAPGVDGDAAAEELDAVTEAFAPEGSAFGELDARALARWAQWEARFGIVSKAPDTAKLFAASFSKSP